MSWVEQDTGFRNRRTSPTDKRDKLERHLCKGNMHLCCHLCRFACKNEDYVADFGRNNLMVDCMKVCDRFENK